MSVSAASCHQSGNVRIVLIEIENCASAVRVLRVPENGVVGRRVQVAGHDSAAANRMVDAPCAQALMN